MGFPNNEIETIQFYKWVQERLGWQIVHLQVRFPDAVIENRAGVTLIAEFEHSAKNFLQHNHDPDGCDLIICWENDWPESPVPVWSLKEYASTMDTMTKTMMEYLGWETERRKGYEKEIDKLRLKLASLNQQVRLAEQVAEKCDVTIEELFDYLDRKIEKRRSHDTGKA